MSKILRKCLSLALAFVLVASLSVGGVLFASADNATGDGLAAYAMRAYNEGCSYVWGGASPGAVDCSGLIYSYVGGGPRVTEDMLYSSPESGYVSEGVPDIPGLGLWQPGHVGVYVGGGMAVDARDEISNVCYQSVSTKSWVMWFKVAGVSYDNSSEGTSVVANNRSDEDSDKIDEIVVAPEVLQYGSTGSSVNQLQEKLKSLGYFDDDTTEYFGYITQNALMDFQKAAGLSMTGVYDEDTQSALQAPNAPRKVVFSDDEEDQSITNTENLNENDEDPDLFDETEQSDNSALSSDEKLAENSEPVPEEGNEDFDNEQSEIDSEQSSANSCDEDEEYIPQDAVFKPGDVASDISDIQYILIKLGYFDYDITGVYCYNTADAVQQFKQDYDCGNGNYLDENTITTMYSVFNGDYTQTKSDAQNALYELAEDISDTSNEIVAESDAENSNETDSTSSEQSVTISLENSETDTQTAIENSDTSENTENTQTPSTDTEVTDQSAESKSEKTVSQKTENASTVTTKTSESKTTTNVVQSPKTSDNSVVFVQTGVDDYFTTTNALIAVGVSLVIIFFAGTMHYWKTSLENRKQRARRATTVSVYHRSSM